MKDCERKKTIMPARIRKAGVTIVAAALLAMLMLTEGCSTKSGQKQNQSFFTSGSREADQRASQKMAQQEQLAGGGQGSAGVATKETKSKESGGGKSSESKQPLFVRLGNEQGLSAIVDDFLQRAMQDPRVNWQRKGVTKAGLFHHGKSVEWQGSSTNVAYLKKHMVEFFSLATGGPAHYSGKEMKEAHGGMEITNPEFDAAVGDLKASLDKLRIPNTEQKEFLAIVETTRAEIVTVR